MRRRFPFLVLLVLLVPNVFAAGDWPRFRGPGGQGVADGQDLPASWNVETGENVLFKTPIPGLGHSSPVVWGDRVFLTSAESSTPLVLKLGDEGGIAPAEGDVEVTWKVLAVHKKSGQLLWTTAAVTAKPRTRRHAKSSLANATPATDGQVLATILGSQGLFVFDLDGKRLWSAELGTLDPGLYGDPSSSWGYASSPIVHDGRVFVQVDRHAESFVAAYNSTTGRQLWKVERDERPAWATPLIHEGAERTELVVLGSVHARAYDPATGRELWAWEDESEVKTPSPFVADERLVLAGGYRGRPIYALPLGKSGELGDGVLWTSERGGPYTSTPVAYGELVFSVADEGILNAWSLASGEHLHRVRTGEHHSASIVASDGKLYLAGEGGVLVVVRAGRELEELARNDMGDALMATPAISDGVLYVRTGSALYAVASSGPPDPKVAVVEKLRAAIEKEDYELARSFLVEDPRVWYDGREGEGFPWKLPGTGRWKTWDRHFNGVTTPQGPLAADSDKVWADFYEMNDYFRLTGRSGGYFRKTWFFDAQGRVEGYMISGVPGAPEPTGDRSEEFKAWAKENAPDELAYLMPGGRIDPTGDRAPRFRALLERWRESIGEPLKD